MKKSQHQKIVEYCSDRDWVCGNEFRTTLFIYNGHKRRKELEDTGKYAFESRPCEHGHPNVRDYRMMEIEPKKLIVEKLGNKLEFGWQGILIK